MTIIINLIYLTPTFCILFHIVQQFNLHCDATYTYVFVSRLCPKNPSRFVVCYRMSSNELVIIVILGIHIVWALLIFVGLASAYFHATLSLMGQLLDELSILWVYTITMILFCPRRKLPQVLKSRPLFSAFLLFFAITASILSVWRPYVNAFALMTLIIPTVYLLCCELERIKHKESEVFSLGIRSLVLMVCAVTVWFNDRIFCDFYRSMQITYLHAAWHVMIFLSSYTSVILFAYFYVQLERPKVSCKLAYWPQNTFISALGIPYVEFKQRKSIYD